MKDTTGETTKEIMLETVKALSEATGPSSREEGVRQVIQGMVEPYADDLQVDSMGNLLVRKQGPGKKVMVAAHMDELGLIVTYIHREGFLRFASVGSISPQVLLGQRVVFPGGVEGTVGCEKLEDPKKLEISKMYLDIGAGSREEAGGQVRIGDIAVFRSSFALGGNCWLGKALDDRVGCGVLVQALRELDKPQNDIYFVFTVQEELGLRGARASAFRVQPDYGLAVDVTPTGDTPEPEKRPVSLGRGPAIKVKDTLIISHPSVVKFMVEAAQREQVPFQYEVLERAGTDSGAIQLVRKGVPSGTLSIPCRHVHTPSEMVDYRDVLHGVRLLKGILQEALPG